MSKNLYMGTIACLLLMMTGLLMTGVTYATSIAVPHTNVGGIANSQSVVAGYVVNAQPRLLSELTGNKADANQVITFVRFQISEVVSGSDLTPGSIIQLNIMGGEKDNIKTSSALPIPDASSKVVFALRRDSGVLDNFKDSFVPQNERNIVIDGETTIEKVQDQVKKIQSADSETLQKMIEEEWKENGIDNPYAINPAITDEDEEHEIHDEDDDSESVEVLDYDPEETLVENNKPISDNKKITGSIEKSVVTFAKPESNTVVEPQEKNNTITIIVLLGIFFIALAFVLVRFFNKKKV